MRVFAMKEKVLVFFLLVLWVSCQRAEPIRGNHVSVRSIKDVETLNPITASGKEASSIIGLMYQPLLSIDLGSNAVEPILAAKLPEVVVQDSVSLFHYRLRPEATWPNGSPITAYDVLFTLKVANIPYIQNERRQIALSFIQDMTIDSSSVRKFTFHCEGYVDEMDIMTGGFPILPAYVYDPQGILQRYGLQELKNMRDEEDSVLQEFAAFFNSLSGSRAPEAYVGSGGYTLVEWVTDQRVVLKRKQEWWAKDLNLPFITANPEVITFQIIPDNAAAVLSLKNEQVDVMLDIPSHEFKKLEQDSLFKEAYELFSPSTYTVNYIGLNGRLPKFSGKRTRQALAHLIDMDNILLAVGQNASSRAASFISPQDNHNYNSKIAPYTYDPDLAKKLLFEDGWQLEKEQWVKTINGKKEHLAFTVQYRAGNFDYENIALIFKHSAGKIDIGVTLRPVESGILSHNLRNHDFDLFIRALVGNPFSFNFMPILHTQSGRINGMNYTAFGTMESDRLIEGIIRAPNKPDQAAQIKALQETLADEANLLFLYFNEQKMAIHKRFDNLKVSGLYPHFDVSALVLKED